MWVRFVKRGVLRLHLTPKLGSFSKTNPPNSFEHFQHKPLGRYSLHQKNIRKTVGSFRKNVYGPLGPVFRSINSRRPVLAIETAKQSIASYHTIIEIRCTEESLLRYHFRQFLRAICHPEQSEGSSLNASQILRFAQNDGS